MSSVNFHFTPYFGPLNSFSEQNANAAPTAAASSGSTSNLNAQAARRLNNLSLELINNTQQTRTPEFYQSSVISPQRKKTKRDAALTQPPSAKRMASDEKEHLQYPSPMRSPMSSPYSDAQTPFTDKSSLPDGSKAPIGWTDTIAYFNDKPYEIEFINNGALINFYRFKSNDTITLKVANNKTIEIDLKKFGIKVRNNAPITKAEFQREDKLYSLLTSDAIKACGVRVPERYIFETLGYDGEMTRVEFVELLDAKKAISVTDEKVFNYGKNAITAIIKGDIPLIPDFHPDNILYDLNGENLYFIDWSSPYDLEPDDYNWHLGGLITSWVTLNRVCDPEILKRFTADFPVQMKPTYDNVSQIPRFPWNKN